MKLTDVGEHALLLEVLKTSKALLERLRACNRDFINEIDEVTKQAHIAIMKAERKES